jgi:hypothetical protein
MPQVTIELARIGKQSRTYHEGFLSDNGVELRTLTILSPEKSENYSRIWHDAGAFPKDQLVVTVKKTLFYREYFAILQLLDAGNRSIGCYVDIATPLKKNNGIYQLTDLILDLWIAPDGCYTELDVDEFEQASAAGKLSPEWDTQARQTFARLKVEIARGSFPDLFRRM